MALCWLRYGGGGMSEPLKVGDKVNLVISMKSKPCFVTEVRTAYAIDGRWYWADGTAVDGSLAYFSVSKS